MTQQARCPRVHERWAHLRFSAIGSCWRRRPTKANKAAIEALAGRTWQHQTAGQFVRFGFSTVQHWYYRACKEGTHPIVYEALAFSEYLHSCAGISREDKENVMVAPGIIRPQFECYGHHRHFSPLPLA
jgi:hypothetical protein